MGDEVEFRFLQRPWAHVLQCLLYGFTTSLVTWIALVVTFQEVLLPHWTPPQRAQLAAAIAVPLGLLCGLGVFYLRAFGVSISSEAIGIHRRLSPSRIPCEDLLAAIGISGISLSGGELLVWKRLVLLTSTRSYTISFEPAANAEIYDRLLEKCVHCLGLPYPPTDVAHRERLHVVWPEVASLLRRSALRKLIYAALLVVPTIIFVVMGIRQNAAAHLASGALPICTVIIAGLYFLVGAVREAALIRKLRRVTAN